jgi:predicted transcriptional regulator
MSEIPTRVSDWERKKQMNEMSSISNDVQEPANNVELAVELTMAWLGNPNTRADPEQVSAFMTAMKSQIDALAGAGAPVADDQAPEGPVEGAVSARKSLSSPDHIISMIDGKPYKTLRRHISGHGLTPQQYRQRYGLRDDYPMVAQTYSDARREMAKKIGLGRKPAAAAAPEPEPVQAEVPAPSPRRRGRPARAQG